MSLWSALVEEFSTPKPAPLPTAPRLGDDNNPITIDQRWRMGAQIYDFEAELDPEGRLKIENLPADDGGGAREVAGINMRYDGPEEAKLEVMVKAGQYSQAQHEAIQYIVGNTDQAKDWCQTAAIEANLRDMIFNRGAGGCVKILQEAIGVTVDGGFGPVTEATEKAAESDLGAFLDDLYRARVWYEHNVIGERANLDAGLMNRFAKARDFAKTFIPSV